MDANKVPYRMCPNCKKSSVKLTCLMCQRGLSSQDMADIIKKSRVTFDKKRFGDAPFNSDEIRDIAEALNLDAEEVKQIFF